MPSDINSILVMDDEPSIHEDFRTILSPRRVDGALADIEERLFGVRPAASQSEFAVSCAHQGRDGVELARRRVDEGRPFSVAFIDMRMPPGWDGLRTVEELWKVDSRMQVVICTAYSDHPWDEVLRQFDRPHRLLVVKKPFEPIEVSQAALALSAKWRLERDLEDCRRGQAPRVAAAP